MPEVFNTGSTFTVRELTGQRRTVILQARGLPYRPYTLKTQQRVSVGWNPGYSIGTANVMGATEAPTTIAGAWKDRFLGDTTTEPCIRMNGVAVTTAREAIKLFDSICREGQEIEVTWDEDVRVGFLEEFESSRQNVHDVDWTMQFVWISRGQAEVAVVLASSVSLATSASQARRRLDTMRAFLSNPPYPLLPDYESYVTNVLMELETDVQNIEAAASTVAVLASSPVSAARQVIASCNSIISTGKELRDYFDSFVPGLTRDVRSLGAQAPSQGDTLAAYQYTRDIRAENASFVNFAVDTRSEYAMRVETELLGMYEAREGDDLRTISQLYYNTPFQWQTIATFNEITDATIHPGDLVLIPKISALENS